MDECAAQGEFLFHAARKFPGAARPERFDLAVYGGYQLVVVPDFHPEQRGEKREVLPDRQVGVEREASGHVTHAFADAAVVAYGVEPVDRGESCVGDEQRRKQPEQRGLARAVGADQPEQLPAPDPERHAVQRRHRPVTLRQPADLYGILSNHGNTES